MPLSDISLTTDLDSAILDEEEDYEMVLSSSLGNRLDSPNSECTHNSSLGPLQEDVMFHLPVQRLYYKEED